MLLFLLAVLYILECASTWEASFLNLLKSVKLWVNIFVPNSVKCIILKSSCSVFFYILTGSVDYLVIWSEVIFLFRQNLFDFGVFFSEVG